MAPRPPFTKTRSREIPWKTLVVKADPDYERLRLDELEYTFSGNRIFTSKNSNRRGVYANALYTYGVVGQGRWEDKVTWEDDAPWNDEP